jgi:PiT family inorganic phosphate transporter
MFEFIDWWLGIPPVHLIIGGLRELHCSPIAVHGFSGYIGAEATYYWYDIVSWYKASKDGGMSEF